ncbi:MAG: hypothetical protein H7Y43_08945 [Akkermansiaceae bacterium]|nr:hypothetical protein [Verrucomicrobiales bacterium]
MTTHLPISSRLRRLSTAASRFPATMLFLCGSMALLAIGCASHQRAVINEAYPYKEPLSSPGQKFSGLPPAVQRTVRAQVGTADIYDIDKLTASDESIYRLTFRNSRLFPPLYVKSDGSVMYPDLIHVAVGAGEDDIGALSGGAVSGLKVSDLPQKVVSTIQEKAPTAEVAFINKVSFNDQTFFEVSFKDPLRNPQLVVAEDGVLVKKIW